jgi:hypothetical protein
MLWQLERLAVGWINPEAPQDPVDEVGLGIGVGVSIITVLVRELLFERGVLLTQ